MTYARSLIPLLQAQVDNLTVLYGKELATTFLEDEDAIQVQNPWISGSRRFLWEQVHLKKVLNERGTQVLYTPYQVAIQPKAIKSVCALRNLEPFFAPQYRYTFKSATRNTLLRRLTRISLRRADRVIAVSDFALNYAVEFLGVPREKIVKVYHGRNESLLRDEVEIDETIRQNLGLSGPYVFTAGSILPYRRVEDVVAAFERAIAPTDPQSMLLIAGSGTDRQYDRVLRDIIESSPYRSRIRMLGYLTQRQMHALYKGCRVFVSASEIEACPNIGIEAMTAGCAVIAAEAGPAREIYGDGSLFYSPRDVSTLADLMNTLWRGESLARELGRKAVARSSVFSWERCAKETAQVLLTT
jgi:glycosyltransferase involved in cell wall biosynthesis